MKFILILFSVLVSIHSYANYYIDVDFSIPSKKARFLLIKDGKIEWKAKCAHGNGQGNTSSKPLFSNKIGSNCSCLGKFEIVGYYEKRGLKYLRLKGLDKTNSNAFKRGICIHNSTIVTIFKYLPFNIPLSNASQGCFAIDNKSMDKLIELYKRGKVKHLYAHI